MSGGPADDPVDRPGPVRSGEEVDLERLAGYLRTVRPELGGEIRLLQFPSGFSNLTYQVEIGGHQLVLRRPPMGTRPRSGHDMGRESTVLTALAGHFPYAPRAILYCDDPSILGAPFLLMERIEGIVLRRDPPPGVDLGPERMRRLCERLVDVHAELHALDYRALGLDDLGRPEGYVRRQVEGWSRRYRRARTPDVPDGERVMAWLERHRPAESGACLIHNDFKLDNVVLDPADPTRVVGVLDWEMATVGDPLMDLGASLAYWIEADDPPPLRAIRMLPTQRPGALTRREVVARYAERSGAAVDRFDFYYAFGLFRLAAIAQQIYYRYFHGQTRDERFAAFQGSVRVLEAAARSAISDAGGPFR